MLLVVDEHLQRHLAVALARYCRDLERACRATGRALPADLAELASALNRQTVTDRHAVTDPADRTRDLAAARSRRYRRRKAGEDVPHRKPGPSRGGSRLAG